MGVSQTSGPLLTKLYIPRPRQGTVARPGLWDQLLQGVERKITLITAPAGFGKTTLVSQWLAAGGERRPTVAWVSLEESDNHPGRFWTYVAEAFAPIAVEVSDAIKSALQAPEMPAPEVLLYPVINGLLAVEGDLVLVLDDYHVIQSAAIHEAMAFLVDHIPLALHVILMSRGDPPLPLARWRAREDLVEIRAQDLRFTVDEAATFLNGAKGLALAPSLIEVLHERTEGWVTGLQLAALSLKGRGDPAAFVQAFAGSHRYVLDYLIEEVLVHQSSEVERFLLQTSILSRLSGPLCMAVTGMPESQQLLQSLEEADLFIVPLDDERHWFRYHHLFADMLRAHLKHTSAGEMKDLHRKACDWFAQAGFVADAIGHGLAAGAWDRAADLLEEMAESTWADGELSQLLTWLKALPAETLQRRPTLSLLYARALIPSGQVDRIAVLVTDAAQALSAGAAQQSPCLAGQVTAMRAQLARLQGDLPNAMALSQQALEELLPTERGWRGLTALAMGGCYRLTGRLTEAREAYGRAAVDCGAAGNCFLRITAANLQAETYQQQGHLQKAIGAFRAISQEVPQHLPVAGWSLVGEGSILRERNDLTEAADLLSRGIELGQRGRLINVVVPGYLELARIRIAQGSLDEAAHLVALAKETARTSGIPRAVGRVIPVQVRLLLQQANVAGATALLGALGAGGGGIAYRLSQARIQMALGRWDEALGILAGLNSHAQSSQELGIRLEGLVLEALCLGAQGGGSAAISRLKEALSLAEPEGYMRLFLDEGPQVLALLAQVQGSPESYRRRLLGEIAPLETTDTSLASAAGRLVEPLTERELEVLRLIAMGASNAEIGQRLFISVNTVKKHTTNIFGKLGAASRTQAIAQARDLGYL